MIVGLFLCSFMKTAYIPRKGGAQRGTSEESRECKFFLEKIRTEYIIKNEL